MNKPNDYDSVQSYDNGRLELGGHYLKILKVVETKAKSGRQMIMIYLDTSDSDKQPNFFKRRFDNDTHTEKKWGCVYYQLVNDPQNLNATNRGLKTFHECVEKSNPGFNVKWGSGYEACFKGKHIGGIFGREQYIGSDGRTHFITKCFYLMTTEEIQNGVDIPEDRLLDSAQKPSTFNPVVDTNNLDDDNDYPF